MWILYAFNDNNGDYVYYYYDYLKIGRGDFYSFSFNEEGYILFAYFCSRYLHFTYQHFVILTSAISTLMLGFVVVRLSAQPNVVLALFMLNPYWMMICQTRFYMAFLCVLVGYVFLIKYEGLKGIVLFLMWVAASGFVHRTGWLCLILVFARIKNRKIVGWLMTIIALAIISFRSPIGLRIALRFLPVKKANDWLTVEAHRSLTGVVILILIRVLLLVAAVYIYRRLKEKGCSSNRDFYLVVGIILMMSFLPMEWIDKNFERFFRFSLMFVYFLYGDFREAYPVRFKSMPFGHVIVAGAVLVYYAFFAVSFSGWFEHNLVPIMENNLLLP
ncbi:MAG: EpsG family protein [Saccharofermentans sp.]|nr:EpsG family protein [Saccharofermentans sp.]